jgi:hypothetical protein
MSWPVVAAGQENVAVRSGSGETAVADVARCGCPEPKSQKNRIHFDLQPQDRTREEEVERLLALGATLVDDRRRSDGTGWAVLADPEGNEFCVERGAGERAAG